MNKIQGIYAASLTVFNQDLSLNVKKTISHADFLIDNGCHGVCLLYTSPSPRDNTTSRMPSSA